MSDSNTRFSDLFRAPYDLRIVWAILPIGLIGLGFALMPLKSWDYWWHIAYGRVINRTHEMPLYADFLYTMPQDAPSYVQAWIAQWALYLIHDAVGLHGVLIMRNVLSVFAFAILGWWGAKRADSFALGSIVTLFAAAFGFLCIAARSHLLAWPMFLALLGIGYAARGGQKSPWLALTFIPIAILWSNVHGTFLIPMLVSLAFFGAAVGDYVLYRDRFDPLQVKVWGITTVGSLLATLVNPRGYEIYLFLHDLTTNQENRTYITEWFPATPWHPPVYGLLFWILITIIAILMWRQRDRVDLADVFLLYGFSALSVGQSRALLWVGLCLPVVAGYYLRPFGTFFEGADSEPGKIAQAANVIVAVSLLLLMVVLQPWTGSNPQAAEAQVAPTRTSEPLLGLVPVEAPVEPLAILADRADREDLQVYHDHRMPGFILWHLQGDQPKQMVYVDNRVELPPSEQWRRFDKVNAGEGWREEFDEYGVDAVVASKDTQGRLVEAMRGQTDWVIEFENEHYALITRK